jgi:hypothetical protein
MESLLKKLKKKLVCFVCHEIVDVVVVVVVVVVCLKRFLSPIFPDTIDNNSDDSTNNNNNIDSPPSKFTSFLILDLFIYSMFYSLNLCREGALNNILYEKRISSKNLSFLIVFW